MVAKRDVSVTIKVETSPIKMRYYVMRHSNSIQSFMNCTNLIVSVVSLMMGSGRWGHGVTFSNAHNQ